MKIAVFGSGGVGGYFGGRLAQAGNEVTFVARGRHLAAMRTEGLKVNSITGDFLVQPVNATDQAGEIGPVDVVLCCVKSWQVPAAADAMAPLVAPETRIITLQNGVDAHTTLAERFGENQVLPGLCRIISMVEGPGRIRHLGADPYIAFGKPDGSADPQGRAIAETFAAAEGMSVELSSTIIPALWQKFMLIAPWSGVGGVTRAPIGVLRHMPETREMLLRSMEEVQDVARAVGVLIADKAIEGIFAFIDSLPPESTSSMQRDLMDGRPSELHEQSGAVVRHGIRTGVPTPVNRFLYHSLLPMETTARAEQS